MDATQSFELALVEDIHLAAAMMALGMKLQGCEVDGGNGWAKFAILVPEARNAEVQRLQTLDHNAGSPDNDVPVPYGQYRKSLNELRGMLRAAKGVVSHEPGRQPCTGATG